MSEKQQQVAIRLPADLLARVDVLLESPMISPLRLNRSNLLRAAFEKGVEVLEAEYLGKKPAGAEQKRRMSVKA